MNDTLSNTYSEVYSYLNVLGDDFISKIPDNVYEKICKEKNNDYTPIYYSFEDYQDMSKMKKNTRVLIVYLHWKYWCDSQEEKQMLENILEENENKFLESYNPFKNTKQDNVNINSEKNHDLIVVNKKWYTKIMEWIRAKFLNKK